MFIIIVIIIIIIVIIIIVIIIIIIIIIIITIIIIIIIIKIITIYLTDCPSTCFSINVSSDWLLLFPLISTIRSTSSWKWSI